VKVAWGIALAVCLSACLPVCLSIYFFSCCGPANQISISFVPDDNIWLTDSIFL
jgi:hypothetical protein